MVGHLNLPILSQVQSGKSHVAGWLYFLPLLCPILLAWVMAIFSSSSHILACTTLSAPPPVQLLAVCILTDWLKPIEDKDIWTCAFLMHQTIRAKLQHGTKDLAIWKVMTVIYDPIRTSFLNMLRVEGIARGRVNHGALKQARHWLHSEEVKHLQQEEDGVTVCTSADSRTPCNEDRISGPTNHRVNSLERWIMRSVGFKVESFVWYSLNLGQGGNRNSNQHVGCRGKSGFKTSFSDKFQDQAGLYG